MTGFLNQTKASFGKAGGMTALKVVSYFLLGILALFTLFTGAKAWFIIKLFSWYSGLVLSQFGLDIMLARAVAIGLTAITLAFLPSILLFLLFGSRKKEVLIVVPLFLAVFLLASYWGTNNVLVDRNNGKPVKYFIKTLDGFKFSNAEDFDPQSSIKYKPITAEVIKEYEFWSRAGKHNSIPNVVPGKYFDMLTGEPIVWYSIHPNEEIVLFSLPGFDPKYGDQLKPVTKEIISKFSIPKPIPAKEMRAEPEKTTSPPSSESKTPEILNKMLNSGKFDLDWYFSCKTNSFALESTEGNTHSKGNQNETFKFRAEKIIFLQDKTLIGVCLYNANSFLEFWSYLIDANKTRHELIRIAKTGKPGSYESESILVRPGEIRRIIFVLDYISIEKINKGKLYIQTSVSEFTIDKKKSPVLFSSN